MNFVIRYSANVKYCNNYSKKLPSNFLPLLNTLLYVCQITNQRFILLSYFSARKLLFAGFFLDKHKYFDTKKRFSLAEPFLYLSSRQSEKSQLIILLLLLKTAFRIIPYNVHFHFVIILHAFLFP